jgi:hypothetical protein
VLADDGCNDDGSHRRRLPRRTDDGPLVPWAVAAGGPNYCWFVPVVLRGAVRGGEHEEIL